MQKHQSIDYTELRKKVSQLYIDVILNKLSVREALTKFPMDCDDKTIIAAWHALCHLEADEDIRKQDEMYKQEQDEYIESIAQILENGQELPLNIINSYIPYHENALISNSKKWQGIIRNIKKFLCC